MHVGKKSQKREKSVMSVSLYGNVVFVVIELIMAIATGSQAVLLDAVYDGVEFFMLLPSVFLIPLLYRPSNEQHPFGYMQLETLFVVVKGITMTAVTFGLIFNNIHLMLHGGHIVSFHTIAGFEMFACILSVIVTIYLRIKNKNLHSPLITMELQGWQIDSVISLGMAFAFLLPLMIPFAWFDRVTPYLDQIITNLRMKGHMIRILFMDASDQVLVKRYKETRRAHPLAGTDRVEKGIEQALPHGHFAQRPAVPELGGKEEHRAQQEQRPRHVQHDLAVQRQGAHGALFLDLLPDKKAKAARGNEHGGGDEHNGIAVVG